jgi:hypothetical protein
MRTLNIIFLTSAVDIDEWTDSRCSHFTPGISALMDPRTFGKYCHCICAQSIPGHPARSQSHYWLASIKIQICSLCLSLLMLARVLGIISTLKGLNRSVTVYSDYFDTILRTKKMSRTAVIKVWYRYPMGTRYAFRGYHSCTYSINRTRALNNPVSQTIFKMNWVRRLSN